MKVFYFQITYPISHSCLVSTLNESLHAIGPGQSHTMGNHSYAPDPSLVPFSPTFHECTGIGTTGIGASLLIFVSVHCNA